MDCWIGRKPSRASSSWTSRLSSASWKQTAWGFDSSLTKQIQNRKELGLPLVARAIGNDYVTHFEECTQRCFALLRRPRQYLGNH